MNKRLSEAATMYGLNMASIATEEELDYNTIIELSKKFKNAINSHLSERYRHPHLQVLSQAGVLDQCSANPIAYGGVSMFLHNNDRTFELFNGGRVMFMKIIEELSKENYNYILSPRMGSSDAYNVGIKIKVGHGKVPEHKYQDKKYIKTVVEENISSIYFEVKDLITIELVQNRIIITISSYVLNNIKAFISDSAYRTNLVAYTLTMGTLPTVVDRLYSNLFNVVFFMLIKERIYSHDYKPEEDIQLPLFDDKSATTGFTACPI